ncbi:MAG: hypothetical protein P1V20_09055 [Verrucomicrobiales bacterium]|nr:hypothetical protein [Verrucomicrobiales bacterium]
MPDMSAMRFIPLLIIIQGVLVSSAEEKSFLPAFPGADGFGVATVGGRGGRVVSVVNLNKRGPGSFSHALNEIKEPRTIVFTVSGVIDCENEMGFFINSENDHVTIAGETSPGGIAIYNYRRFEIKEGAQEVIMRFMRFRGTRIHVKNDPDSLLIWKARNVIVDHCSFAGACDETISTSQAENVTIQWTGYDESRKEKAHADWFDNDGQWHNYGGLYSQSKNITIHHCLFAHHSKRNPLVKPDSYVESINNVIYNYSNSQQTWGAAGEGLVMTGCFFKLGPDRRKRPVPVRDNALFVSGCLSQDENQMTPVPDINIKRDITPTLQNIETAKKAWQSVLTSAGALPHDATSARMVHETKTGTGKQGYSADIEADREALKKNQHPPPRDSDGDGLPDDWEEQHKLNPGDASDSRQLTKSGYSSIEIYCHQLASELILSL